MKKIEIEVEDDKTVEDVYEALENRDKKHASFETKKKFAVISFWLIVVFGAGFGIASYVYGTTTANAVEIAMYCFTAIVLGFMGFDSFENVKNGRKR